MSINFPMGALNKETNEYEYSKIANKKNDYECPSCGKDVIFRSGKKNQPHFAHCKSDNPCNYYEKPNETQIHKEGKLIMKNLLHNENTLILYRNCGRCKLTYFEHTIGNDNDYNENTFATTEYKFYYNDERRSADVALIEDKKIKYIFEICYSHKTKEEDRPDPWFEINAIDLINNINSIKNAKYKIRIECKRDFNCGSCKEHTAKEIEDEILKEERKIECKRIEQERLKQERLERIIYEENKLKEEIALIKQREEERIIERKRKEEERKRKEEEKKRENDILIKLLEGNKRCDTCRYKKKHCSCAKITDYFKK